MAYKHGHFVWFELVVPEIDKGKAFYTEVMGWGSMEMPMGPDATYLMLTKNDKPQCGVVNARMEGIPAHWTSYVSVDDVDAAAQRVIANGGKVIMPGIDVPQVGRMALVADPEGATFNLFKGEDSDDMASDAFHWNELWAKDPAKVAGFYEKVLNLTSETTEMGPGPYTVFSAGGAPVAGLVKTMDEKIPSMWLPYIEVDDADAAIGRVTNHGGDVKMPAMDVPEVGRFGVVGDSSGAVLGLIKPAKKA